LSDRSAATFDTNVLGVLLSMKHQVRVMQQQGSGNIVNISSTYGHEGAAGAAVYEASYITGHVLDVDGGMTNN
jgi:NADP-dependent 3-hydroxy acid dehydrogenase YdfG